MEYYLLATPEDLAWFRDAVNAPSADAASPGINAKLTADIDLSDSNPWTPIGQSVSGVTPNGFTGIFDGDGHCITGYTVTTLVDMQSVKTDLNGNQSTLKAAGLFGFVSGTIKNLRASGAVIINESGSNVVSVGGIVGYLHNSASIENCAFFGTAEESKVTVNAVLGAFAGGIVGMADMTNVPILGCSNESAGDITLNTKSSGRRYSAKAGGIVGVTGESTAVINCVKSGSGNVSATDSGSTDVTAGGIAGDAYFYVQNCMNRGEGGVTAKYSGSASDRNVFVGGIAGYTDNDSPVTNCTNSSSGNIYGYSSSNWTNSGIIVGGIVAYTNANVTNCVNNGSGDIIGEASGKESTTGPLTIVGGIVGSTYGKAVENCVNRGSGDIIAKGGKNRTNCAGGIAGRASGTSVSDCLMTGTGSIEAMNGNISKVDSIANVINGGSITNCGWIPASANESAGSSGDTTKITEEDKDGLVGSLTASISSDTMYTGSSETITVSAVPGDNGTINITDFSSSDGTVVAVSRGEYGKLVLTGVSEGTATITLSAEAEATDFSNISGGAASGDVTGEAKKIVLENVSFTVTVNNVALEGISLPETLEMKAGGSQTLSVTFTPGNATNKAVTWSSSNENVVKVTPSAEKGAAALTAVSAGTAAVTATSDEGAFTAQCSVTVTAEPAENPDTPETPDTPDTPGPTPEQPQHSGGGGGCSAGFGALALLAFIPIMMRKKK